MRRGGLGLQFRVFVCVFLEKMTDVMLHIYDVTNSGSDKTNNTIVNINKIFKDGIGLGGIFHSAVQVSRFLLCFFSSYLHVNVD